MQYLQQNEIWHQTNGFNGEKVNLCTLIDLKGPNPCKPDETSINMEVADDIVSSIQEDLELVEGD